MMLARFTVDGRARLGDVVGDEVVHPGEVMTLAPGDPIATGTRAAVGIAGVRFLKQGLGAIENRFVMEA
jgi:2-keto-4-pentenoate hydratase/2-oxohepta-3-ene-1,7-dioic acid hydratase in catechol pathway